MGRSGPGTPRATHRIRQGRGGRGEGRKKGAAAPARAGRGQGEESVRVINRTSRGMSDEYLGIVLAFLAAFLLSLCRICFISCFLFFCSSFFLRGLYMYVCS